MRGIKVRTIANPGRITATTTSAALDLFPFDGVALLHMKSTGTEAAATTMDIKIQSSADGTTNWADATMPITGSPMAFTQVVNAATAGQTLEINIVDLKRFIRVVQTLAGTSPAGAAYVVLVTKARQA